MRSIMLLIWLLWDRSTSKTFAYLSKVSKIYHPILTLNPVHLVSRIIQSEHVPVVLLTAAKYGVWTGSAASSSSSSVGMALWSSVAAREETKEKNDRGRCSRHQLAQRSPSW